MARNKKNSGSQALKEFVTVAFAEDLDLAKQYKQVLEENEIPAAVKAPQPGQENVSGIPIMVPEDLLDKAHQLIESQGTYNDFYEMAFQDTCDDYEYDQDEQDDQDEF